MDVLYLNDSADRVEREIKAEQAEKREQREAAVKRKKAFASRIASFKGPR